MRFILILPLIFGLAGCGLFFPEFANSGTVSETDLIGVLYINEYSADNPLDDDWVELYNASSRPIDLSGFYVSDNPDNLIKWEIPANTYIIGKGYLVMTFNANTGLLNANFGLSPDLDGLYLSSARDLTIIDSVPTLLSSGSGSQGRNSDGSSTWITFTPPTKGAANQ